MANKEFGSYEPPDEGKRTKDTARQRRAIPSNHDSDLPYISREIYEKIVPEQPKNARTLAGEISLQPQTNMLFREGQDPKELSEVQAAILEKLIEEAGKAVSPEELSQIYGANVQDPQRAIRLVINRFRKKLGEDPSSPQIIKNFHGRGYGLAVPFDEPIPQDVRLQRQIAHTEITLNTSTGEVRREENEPEELSVNEGIILQTLMEHPGEIYDPFTLYATCYPDEEISPDDPAILAIKVLINRIRIKIGDTEPENPLIVTYKKPRNKPGDKIGYSFGFAPQEESSSPE